MDTKILIIEDDKEISDMVSEFLKKNNYNIVVSNDGINGVKKANEENPDIVILDIMLPYKSGDEVLKEIRGFSECPIIVVSAKETVQIKVDLLRLGADDYITKPFDLNELLARIEVNLKRSGKQISSGVVIKINGLVLNYDLKLVKINEKEITLTSKEFEILYLLMKYPQKVFSKKNLYETVWDDIYAYDNDTINTHISNIRKKLDVDAIETVWGMGYKLKDTF